MYMTCLLPMSVLTLWTPYKEWEGITDKELRSYVNVIEDTRIDKLIQKKYPGVVKKLQKWF